MALMAAAMVGSAVIGGMFQASAQRKQRRAMMRERAMAAEQAASQQQNMTQDAFSRRKRAYSGYGIGSSEGGGTVLGSSGNTGIGV